MGGKSLRDDVAPQRLGHGIGCQRNRTDPLPLLHHGGVRVRQGGQEELHNGLDSDAGIDFGGRLADLPREQLRQIQAAADLCDDRRAGRGAEQHVGIQQGRRRGRRLVGDSDQNACLPSDSGDSAAAQHQRTFTRHAGRMQRRLSRRAEILGPQLMARWIR